MPKLLKTPFAIDAAEGFRTDIQESTGDAPNSATYQVGFPPVTMQSIASNGMPPKGSDLNGVLYDITDNLVFLTQGGGYGFDSAYATSIGGYPLNARLRLTNGDIVKSTIDGNVTNPNVDMTGWVNAKDVVSAKSVKFYSDSNINTALLENNSINFDVNQSVTAPVMLQSGKSITSDNFTLNQTTPETIVLESEFGATDIVIDGLSIEQDKSGSVSGGTGNNHASVKMKGARRARIRNLLLNGQLGISLGMGVASETERRSMFNFVENILMLDTNMGWEQIGASYNIGNNLFIMSALARGVFIGDRMTGYDQIENPLETAHAPCHGNLATNVFIRNMATGISLQNSAKYNSKINYFITECDRAVQLIQGTVLGNNPALNNLQIISEKCGQLILNDGGNNNTFRFVADGSSFTDQGIQEAAGFTGKGFNQYLGIIKNSAKTGAQFRYSHNLYGLQVSTAVGNGVNINGSYGNGPITVSNATGTGISLAGNYNNLQIVATECLTAMAVAGGGNTINIQTDGNVTVAGSGNTITGRIGGNITITGNDNKLIGEVVGTVTRTGTTGNDFTGLKGWSGNIVLPEQTTDGSGRVTVTVPKHTSAQIRNIYATIPTNTSEWVLKVISVSAANVLFELQDNAGNAVPTTAVTFNYSYSCS